MRPTFYSSTRPTPGLTLPRTMPRTLIALVLASQVLGCSAGTADALARQSLQTTEGTWPEGVPVAVPPSPPQPNFKAPTAQHCARPIRSREVPGGQVQRGPTEGDVWAMPAPAPGIAHGSMRSEAMLEKSADVARSDKGTESRTQPPIVAAPEPAFMPPPDASVAKAAAATGRIASNMESHISPRQQQPALGPVTAGVVDDNANFGEYLAFRARTQVPHSPRDVSERYLLQVRDTRGHSVADAEVRIQAPGGSAMWARTDAGGQVWVSPNAFDASHANTYQVNVRKPGRFGMTQATGFLQRGQKSAIEVTLDAAPPQRAQLDLVFLIDATGSMGDEIDKLKATLRTIANEVASLPAKPDLCFGLVAYRDKQDEYLIRSYDFTNDLNAFQGVLNQLRANGGGDYPEAMNEALHDTVHNLSWRGNGTTRMVFLIADAPPHLDYGGPRYDNDMVAALGKGIKVFGVGASGLDKQGEYIQRQIAQYTGGKFVFLTYDQASNPASGPGRETVHDVSNYGVDTLDRLIVRLVREDLAKLGG